MHGNSGLLYDHELFIRYLKSSANGPALYDQLGIDRHRHGHKIDSLVRITDLKKTNRMFISIFFLFCFSFWSSLLSAMLTYHVNWLYSYVTEPTEFFDCGTRVLVLSKDGGLAQRLLHVLSYFVRVCAPAAHPSAEMTFSDLSPRGTNGGPMAETYADYSTQICHSKSMFQLGYADGASSLSPVVLPMRRNGSSLLERQTPPGQLSQRRSSQQLVENTRYLRNYYDVRFQLSPDTIAKRDPTKAFANLISSIAKNGFHDFYTDELATTDKPRSASCAFFVGSIPDKSNSREESPSPMGNEPGGNSTGACTTTRPVQVQIPRYYFLLFPSTFFFDSFHFLCNDIVFCPSPCFHSLIHSISLLYSLCL